MLGGFGASAAAFSNSARFRARGPRTRGPVDSFASCAPCILCLCRSDAVLVREADEVAPPAEETPPCITPDSQDPDDICQLHMTSPLAFFAAWLLREPDESADSPPALRPPDPAQPSPPKPLDVASWPGPACAEGGAFAIAAGLGGGGLPCAFAFDTAA